MELLSLRGICSLLLTLGFVAACGRAPDTPVTRDQNVPVRPLETKVCSPDAAGNYGEHVTMNMGDGDYVWAEGGSCILRPIREVWGAMHNQNLILWDGISESQVTVRPDRPQGVSHHYEILYIVKDIITVDWTMEWHHTVQAGSFDLPKKILINYQRTKGTRYISYWEGSIVLDFISPTVTSFQMRDQIRRTRAAPEKSAAAINTLLGKLRNGEPDWKALEAGAHVTNEGAPPPQLPGPANPESAPYAEAADPL